MSSTWTTFPQDVSFGSFPLHEHPVTPYHQIDLVRRIQNPQPIENMVVDWSGEFNERHTRSRPIKVTLCDMPERDNIQIWITPTSTIGNVNEELDTICGAQMIILVPKHGPMTSWVKADPNSLVGHFYRTLYAVTATVSRPYMLVAVRSTLADYPILIFEPSDSSPTITISQVMATVRPDLQHKIHTIYDTSNGKNIGDHRLEFKFQRTDMSSPRSAGFLIALVGVDTFLRDVDPVSIPPFLQLHFARCGYLSTKMTKIEPLNLQIKHILRCARHIITAFSAAVSLLFEEVIDTEVALIRNEDLVELLPVVPQLAFKLGRILDRVEKLIRDIETNKPISQLKSDARLCFLDICGDFPGSTVVRNSFMKVSNIFGLSGETIATHGNAVFISDPPHASVPQIEDGTPDAELIARLFRNPQISNGDVLRTFVYTVLNSPWFKKKRLHQMPRGILDSFAQRRGETTVCLFCETSYGRANEGLGCVKAHLGL
ncbi:hypothetical protein M408DRAFT_328929 [Serendipita vermifera MAFF 305830]|uniref:Uncharacterized protein n=1 Tax=Serendipita vermifera MAFF 305830 TaxID=933852 RepID=A0A0C2XJN3_SERVB|nr:hypothetical protein M408DRAFT_328929 [Serendipita vermifera MAFF 305830]